MSGSCAGLGDICDPDAVVGPGGGTLNPVEITLSIHDGRGIGSFNTKIGGGSKKSGKSDKSAKSEKASDKSSAKSSDRSSEKGSEKGSRKSSSKGGKG